MPKMFLRQGRNTSAAWTQNPLILQQRATFVPLLLVCPLTMQDTSVTPIILQFENPLMITCADAAKGFTGVFHATVFELAQVLSFTSNFQMLSIESLVINAILPPISSRASRKSASMIDDCQIFINVKEIKHRRMINSVVEYRDPNSWCIIIDHTCGRFTDSNDLERVGNHPQWPPISVQYTFSRKQLYSPVSG